MKSPLLALSWGYLSFRRRFILLGIIIILFLIVIPSIIIHYIQNTLPISNDIEFERTRLSITVTLYLTLFFSQVLSLSLFLLYGFRHRLYTLPISTKSMVVIVMTLEMLVIFLLFLVFNTIFLYASGTHFPLWGYALLAVTWMAILQGTLWASPSILAKSVLLLLGGISLYFFYNYRNGVREVLGAREIWRNLSSWQLAFMGFCVFCSYVLAYIGATRERRGDISLIKTLERLIVERFTREKERTKIFSSQSTAQIWLEQRRQGHGLSLFILGWFIMIGISVAFGNVDMDTIQVTVLGMLFCIFGLSLMIGSNKQSRHIYFREMKLEPDIFRYTKPITSRDLSLAMLVSGLLEIIFMLFLLSACILAAYIILTLQGEGGTAKRLVMEFLNADIFHLKISGYSFAIFLGYGILLISWISLGLGLSLSISLKERKTVFNMIFFLLLFSSLFSAIIWIFFPGSFVTTIIQKVLWKCFGICSLFWAILTYCCSWNFHHLNGKDFVKILVLWGIIIFLNYFIGYTPVIDKVDLILISAGISSLAILPFAAAPMALYWNRHR